MRFCLTKRFILLTCLFLMPYQIVYSDDYYEHNLCDIDNNSRLSLSDIIYGLQVLSGNREEVDVSQEINKTISALVESLRINSNNLSNFHFEKFFHSDFLHEGEDKNLFLSRLSHDLRGENLPENFMLLNDIIKSDLTRKIVTAEIKISFGDLWTVDLKKDIETNEWLFFGDQNKYDYGIRFKIERTYPGGRISRVASVKTRTWNIELEEVKISGPTFLGWHQVKLDYFEQLTFFYTPTESISATNWRYELWSDSFENFPPENSEFSFSMNDGDKVEIFSCFSGPVTHEALEGTGPKDYYFLKPPLIAVDPNRFYRSSERNNDMFSGNLFV